MKGFACFGVGVFLGLAVDLVFFAAIQGIEQRFPAVPLALLLMVLGWILIEFMRATISGFLSDNQPDNPHRSF